MNSITTKASTLIASKFGRTALVLQKYSPEILLGVGIIGAIGAAVLASKATLKAGDIVEQGKFDLEKIDMVRSSEKEEVYSQNDYLKDRAIVYVRTGVNLGKLYAPALSVGALSIVSILASHGIMNRRNVGLMAAYNVVAESFSKYRSRVVDDLGRDADRKYRFGVEETEVEETTTNSAGTEVTAKKKIKTVQPITGSDYAVIFDEFNQNWHRDPTYNMHFLTMQQTWFNDKLRINGHVFLNEVYDALGFPRTSAGAVVGWLRRDKDDPRGDGQIDFDLYSAYNSEAKRDFLNNRNPSILLDFNVDSKPIWDQI